MTLTWLCQLCDEPFTADGIEWTCPDCDPIPFQMGGE